MTILDIWPQLIWIIWRVYSCPMDGRTCWPGFLIPFDELEPVDTIHWLTIQINTSFVIRSYKTDVPKIQDWQYWFTRFEWNIHIHNKFIFNDFFFFWKSADNRPVSKLYDSAALEEAANNLFLTRIRLNHIAFTPQKPKMLATTIPQKIPPLPPKKCILD